MPAAFLRVPLAVALVAECDAVADVVRELRSLRDRFNMVRNIRRNASTVSFAVVTEILVPAHDRCRPVTMPLFVVCRVR